MRCVLLELMFYVKCSRSVKIAGVMTSIGHGCRASIGQGSSARCDDFDGPGDRGWHRRASVHRDTHARYRRVTGWRSGLRAGVDAVIEDFEQICPILSRESREAPVIEND